MATRPLEARDFAVTSESADHEPYSNVKEQLHDPRAAAEACDLCQCVPCQCDKMDKNFPYEVRTSTTVWAMDRKEMEWCLGVGRMQGCGYGCPADGVRWAEQTGRAAPPAGARDVTGFEA